MDRRTPGPVRPSQDPLDSTEAWDAPEWQRGSQHASAGPISGADTHARSEWRPSSVATYRAQIAYLTERSVAAMESGQPEPKRRIDYALALAYAQLGEALLVERELGDPDDEGCAESAMTCFSDAATLFHALGAEEAKEHALRRARYAHELYSR